MASKSNSPTPSVVWGFRTQWGQKARVQAGVSSLYLFSPLMSNIRGITAIYTLLY